MVADQYGKVVHLSERDCSIQRRHQKLVESSPAPCMSESLREKITEAAIKGVSAIGYEGVGTMEFLVDPYENFYFMEMNTRIQVEYLVTEAVTGIDLLRTQIAIAAGQPLDIPHLYPKGHALEVRINAEDPFHGFRPAPGKINHIHFPGGMGITIASHIYAGYVVPPYYDAMIAKLIVYAYTRVDAMARMKCALEELVIEGVPTNIPFYRALVVDETFQTGYYTTQYLDTFDFSLLKPIE